MSSNPPANLPVALRSARRQLDRWRSRHRPHTRLPEELWRKAVTVAHRHGLNRTASALGLKYYSLKKRMEATVGDLSKGEETPCEFVEFLAGCEGQSDLRSLRPRCGLCWIAAAGGNLRPMAS